MSVNDTPLGGKVAIVTGSGRGLGLAYAAELASTWGVPDRFTFRSDTLLPPSDAWDALGHATDGKGIDHFFDVYGERIVGALFAALASA